VTSILDALEEQVVLLRLLHEMASEGGVSVRIGRETGQEALAGTSIVAAGYGNVSSPALLGALGPMRMDYPGTMAAVRAVARYLSKVVET
jgi:heat-inducible transcriptional repressor